LLAQTKKNEEILAKTFELAEVAPQDIVDYQKLKAELKKNEIDILDVGAINTYVTNIRESGNSPKQFVEMGKNHQLLKNTHDKTTRRLYRTQKALSEKEQTLLNIRLELALIEPRVTQLMNQEQAIRFDLYVKYGQYSKLQNDIQQLYLNRKEIIAQVGRFLSLSEAEIICLQAQAQIEIVLQIFEKRRLDAIKKLQAHFKTDQ
jgi:hypothetical protein